MQSQPRCHQCAEQVEDPIFEAPCGHDECPSVVFHGACLMEWRESQVEVQTMIREAGAAAFDSVHQTMVSAMMKLLYDRGQWPHGEEVP